MKLLMQVSLDLSSFELVQHCKETLLYLLEEHYVDIVACNEEEAEAFSDVWCLQCKLHVLTFL